MLKKIITLIAAGLFVFSAIAAATERAEFWNLGFSGDSSTFAFGQYWLTNGGNGVSGSLYVVDTAGNRFVANGTGQYRDNLSPEIGNDGRNVIIKLYEQKRDLFAQYAINPLFQGRIIYLDLDADALNDTLSFKDFHSKRNYSVSLTQTTRGNTAAFSIAAAVTPSGAATRRYTIGLPNFFRSNVLRYEIAQIIVAPDDRTHVFVIEQLIDAESTADNQLNTRYMVETVLIN